MVKKEENLQYTDLMAKAVNASCNTNVNEEIWEGCVPYAINYEQSYKNNFRTDVKKAVKFYLELHEDFKYSEEDFCGFILYPQALNPFLKTMETMGESKNIIILPAYNQEEDHNSPAYLIIKFDGESKYVNYFRTNRV
jgi:hypothetical protein